MRQEGNGWACQDPDCLDHLVVVYPDTTLHIPTFWTEREMKMKNQVFRDPSEKQTDTWRVAFGGELKSACFNSKGAAQAYLDLLETRRKPVDRKIEIVQKYEHKRGYVFQLTGYISMTGGGWTGQTLETNGTQADAFLKGKGFLETTEEIAFQLVFGDTDAYEQYKRDILDPRD